MDSVASLCCRGLINDAPSNILRYDCTLINTQPRVNHAFRVIFEWRFLTGQIIEKKKKEKKKRKKKKNLLTLVAQVPIRS